MKNLKKILSLVLALAMALSLMTVAFAKDTGDFADGDDVTYAEAVDVMATVGVFNGVGDGSNFDPKGTLTREQAAKIITYMIMGQAQADKLVATIAPFADVSADRWSAGAIAYCASEGIMNGTGSGRFNPTGELTGLQFAKMLLVALGYDAEIEEMSGTAWGLATSKLAYAVELDDGMDDINLTAPMTREQAAQMAFTAMKTPTVRYPSKGSTIAVNGAVVEFGAQEAEYVTTTIAKEQTISDTTLSNTNQNVFTIEFGEKYCPKLVLKSDNDDFKRPAHTWTYDKKDIGTYVDYDLMMGEYTVAVDGKDLFDLLGKSVIADNDVTYYLNGKTDTTIEAKTMVKANDKDYTTTGNGVLTQVFVDTSKEEITIVSIDTFLAEANADYNEKKETLSVKIYAEPGTGKVGEDNEIKLDDIAAIESAKKDDRFLVQVAWNDNNKYEIVAMEDAEVNTDSKLTKYSKDKYVVGSGTQYDYAKSGKIATYSLNEIAAYANNALNDFTYNLYFDQYGYLIGNEVYSGTDNYVFITGYDLSGSNLATATATAGAIFLDGTMSNIQVAVKDSNKKISTYNNLTPSDKTYYPELADGGANQYNKWFTYTTDEKNGTTVYTLDPADNWLNLRADTATTKVINSANVRLAWASDDMGLESYTNGGAGGSGERVAAAAGTRIYGNDDSVYITVDTGDVSKNGTLGITEVTGTYTGVQNVDLNVWIKGTADGQNKLTPVTRPSDGSQDATNPYPVISGTAADNRPYGVFAVYDKDLYIIGAVIVGEDNTNSSNYAYVLDDAENEYIDEDGNHYWDFKAVVDGKIVTLTAKVSNAKYSDLNTEFGNLCGQGKNGLAKVTYDKDGYVTKLEQQVNVNTTDKIYGTDGTSDYTDDIDPDTHKVYTVEYKADTSNAKLPVKASFMQVGRTLYNKAAMGTGDNTDAGLTLETGAPVIVVRHLVYAAGGDTTVYEEYTTIEAALNALDNHKTAFTGWVSAVLNNKGTATWIVINDGDDYTITNNNGPDNTPSETNFVWHNTDDIENPTYKGANAPTPDDIYELLTSKEYTDIEVAADGTWSFKSKSGLKRAGVTITAARVITLTVNNVAGDYAYDDDLGDILSANKTANTYVKWTDVSATGAARTKYTAADDTSQTFEDGDIIESADRYVKVTTAIAKPTATSTAASIAASDLDLTTSSAALKETVDSDGASASYLKVGGTYHVVITIKTAAGADKTCSTTALAATVASNSTVTVGTGAANVTAVAANGTLSDGDTVEVPIVIGGTAAASTTLTAALQDKV